MNKMTEQLGLPILDTDYNKTLVQLSNFLEKVRRNRNNWKKVVDEFEVVAKIVQSGNLRDFESVVKGVGEAKKFLQNLDVVEVEVPWTIGYKGEAQIYSWFNQNVPGDYVLRVVPRKNIAFGCNVYYGGEFKSFSQESQSLT